jgi:hypothetical protein
LHLTLPRLALQGSHPDHPGLSDPALLGHAERFFLAVPLRVPRMAQRLGAMAFMRSLAPGLADLEVGVTGGAVRLMVCTESTHTT